MTPETLVNDIINEYRATIDQQAAVEKYANVLASLTRGPLVRYATQVHEARQAQKAYFKTRSPQALNTARELESKLDEATAAALGHQHSTNQTSLFS